MERALLAVFSRHPRLGHRKAKVLVNRLLAAQGLPAVGLRQIRRLRRLLCLSVPQEKPRRPRRGHTTGRIPTKAAYARHVWTWDFVSDITTRGGGFRTLVLIDEHTKQCVAHHVARRIGADDVMAVLSKAIEAYGAPEHIRSDNGPEFIARAGSGLLRSTGIDVFPRAGANPCICAGRPPSLRSRPCSRATSNTFRASHVRPAVVP